MDRFEQAFWSGQIDRGALPRAFGQPTQSMAACFVAAMREWKRSFESQSRSFAGLQMRIEKVMNVSIAREVERLERRLLVLATVGSAGPFVGLFGTVWASCRASVDRGLEKHLAGGGGPGHRRGAVCHRDRPYRRHSGDYFLQ